MSPFTTFVRLTLCILLTLLGYKLTDSILVACLFMVAGVAIGKTLQSVLDFAGDWLKRKLFRVPDVSPFFEENLEPNENSLKDPLSLGYRVLCMTEETACSSKNKVYYNQMVDFALATLSERYPLFALRLRTARERKSGVQYAWSLCGEAGKKMKKCIRIWLSSPACRLMKSREKDKDFFIIDGELTKRDGAAVPFTVMILFDSSLPTDVPAPVPEETAEADTEVRKEND